MRYYGFDIVLLLMFKSEQGYVALDKQYIIFVCFFQQDTAFSPFLYMWMSETAQSMYAFEETGLIFYLSAKR